MGKIGDLQKRRERIEKELEKAKLAYKKQEEIIEKKTAALEQINMDIVSQLLVEKGMDMKDLMSLLGNDVVTQKNEIPVVPVELDHSDLGGNTDEN